jgi:hypothetical protein
LARQPGPVKSGRGNPFEKPVVAVYVRPAIAKDKNQ